MEVNERTVQLPPDGLMLSAKLAELLNVQVGDTLTLTVVRDSEEIEIEVTLEEAPQGL